MTLFSAPPQVETAYRKYELDTDELGLKSKVVKLMYTRILQGSVERKQVSDAPQFFCEILVYGKIERILKFEKSLRDLFHGVPLRCTVLRREEFVELDEGVLAKLVKTGMEIVVETHRCHDMSLCWCSRQMPLFIARIAQVARTSCFAAKEILSAWTTKHRGGTMCL